MKATDENKVRVFLTSALDMGSGSPFIRACQVVKLPPTRRQASKWLAKRGKAYKEGRY